MTQSDVFPASRTSSQTQRASVPSPEPSTPQYESQRGGPEQSDFPSRQSVTGSSSFFPLRTIEEGRAMREWAMNATLEELEDSIIFSEYLHDREAVHIMSIVLKERTRR